MVIFYCSGRISFRMPVPYLIIISISNMTLNNQRVIYKGILTLVVFSVELIEIFSDRLAYTKVKKLRIKL